VKGPRGDARTQAHYARPEVQAVYRSDGELTLAERRLVERFLEPRSRVLDVGTGAGRVALALAREGFVVTGLDVSEPMLVIARESSARVGLDVTWVPGEAEHLPFEARSFDGAIYACNGIGHLTLDGKAHALRELARVVRPGGAVVLSARSPYALNRLLPGLVFRTGRSLLGGPGRDEQDGQPFVHRPSMRTLERLVGEAGLELVESTSHRVVAKGTRPGRLTPYLGGQFYLVARAR
jgi:ubiquinone/menaquinone biosynthesis C-methylase UbiE